MRTVSQTEIGYFVPSLTNSPSQVLIHIQRLFLAYTASPGLNIVVIVAFAYSQDLEGEEIYCSVVLLFDFLLSIISSSRD
jgi:hypothetical protein